MPVAVSVFVNLKATALTGIAMQLKRIEGYSDLAANVVIANPADSPTQERCLPKPGVPALTLAQATTTQPPALPKVKTESYEQNRSVGIPPLRTTGGLSVNGLPARASSGGDEAGHNSGGSRRRNHNVADEPELSLSDSDSNGSTSVGPKVLLYQLNEDMAWEHFSIYEYSDLQRFHCILLIPATSTLYVAFGLCVCYCVHTSPNFDHSLSLPPVVDTDRYCWLSAEDSRMAQQDLVTSFMAQFGKAHEFVTAPALKVVVEKAMKESTEFIAAFESGL